MRGSEPGELLKIVVSLLEEQVLPAVESRAGRSTLLLSVGILDNLAERVEERHDLVERERDVVEQLMAAAPDRLRTLAAAQPDAPSERPAPASPLLAAFRALVTDPDLLREPETEEWLSACHAALKERTRQEVALLEPTRYLRSQNQ
jgi:hypothetical protein